MDPLIPIPPKSQAELLAMFAKCAQIVFPKARVWRDETSGHVLVRRHTPWLTLRHDSLDSIARLVAAMTNEQRERLDQILGKNHPIGAQWMHPTPSILFLIPAPNHLAAISDALGILPDDEQQQPDA